MFLYPYRCPQGHSDEQRRQVDDRDAERPCATCGEPLRRVFGEQVRAQQFLWHQYLWNQWYDVHDKSPREMAQNPNISRYDPSMAEAPPTTRPNLRQYLPKSGDPTVEGAALRSVAPVEGEAPYEVVNA